MILTHAQGYCKHLNVTDCDKRVNKGSGSNLKHFKLKDFSSVFQHYRGDSDKRREPRFISFQTKDDNIEVEIDFAIPFLSIPVKRSLTGAVGTIKNVIRVRNFVTKLFFKSFFSLC